MNPKLLRFAAHFARHRFSSLHPFEVQAVLQNACNLRCSYCRCPELDPAVLGTQQWLDIIAGLERVGTLRIKFQGGEPTLRPDFDELCAAVQRHRIISAVVTNGIAIARRPALLDHLEEVVVSIDSATPEAHDRQRGAGTHALAVRALDLARERGLRAFVNMTVTNLTLDEVDPLLAFCEARGVGFNAQPAMFSHKYHDPSARHLALSREDEQAMEWRLAAWQRQGRPVMFAAQAYEHAAQWADYREPTRRSDGPSSCMAGRFYVHIEPNGDVHPCVLHDSVFIPKNLVSDGFEAALQHAQHHSCGDCFLPYLNERKALFALRPSAVIALVRRG